jgi:hypothetical protein
MAIERNSSLPATDSNTTASSRAPSGASQSSSKISPSLLSRIKRFMVVFVVSTVIAFGISKRLQIPLSIMLWYVSDVGCTCFAASPHLSRSCFVPNWVVGFMCCPQEASLNLMIIVYYCCPFLIVFTSSINTSLHERLYDFTGASTFVATTLYSLVSSHPDVVERMNSFFKTLSFNDTLVRNLIVTAAVVAWAVRF